ncbi:MAG TPA: hypothetical protein VJU86_16085 [Pyrinomonadaceae bacterium]|nr:hypothetical protein [Pyrinomonadaceae bacterium]
MIISIAIVLLATAGGTLATYLYDERSAIGARLCAGACIGIAALGLIGFIFTSLLGLTSIAIILTCLVLALPGLSLRNSKRRKAVSRDLGSIYHVLRNPRQIPVGYTVLYLLVAAVLWRCFQRAMLDLPDGISTGLPNNYGDLPFHLSVITSFVYGHNFMPEDPTYAGVFFTYPFLTDFVSAIFVYCGASLRDSMFIENFVVGLAFFGLVHYWALVMLRDRCAAIMTPLLIFLNGGLGWIFLWTTYTEKPNFTAFLRGLPNSFTILPDTTWRWGNAMSTLLIPQRGFLLGLPLAVIVFTQWWLSGEPETESGSKADQDHAAKRKTKAQDQTPATVTSIFPLSPAVRRMIGAGLIAGLIPLVHAHSFVSVMMVGAGIALLERRWRHWFAFFAAASLIALPQLWWSTHNSAVKASTFFDWQLGWDRGKEDVIWFWFKNSGLFIPMTIAALFWGGKRQLVSRRLLLYFLPFTLCFIIPNVAKLAPWIWDNVKVLFYWWLGSAPLVALLLARLWKQELPHKVAAGLLFVCLTAAGALDVATIMFRSAKLQIFTTQGVAFAEYIKTNTRPRSLILHAPVHNHPVFLTGRRSLMGYPGHVWTHGLEFVPRQSEIRRIYAGAPDALELLSRNNISYVVIGPAERNDMTVNDRFFSNFELAGEVGAYRLYKVR